MQVTLRIFRLNPKIDNKPRFDVFKVDAKPTDRLLDCLNTIRWEQDSTLAYRMSCMHGICGSDGMTINGVSALACQKLVKNYDYSKEIVIEPLRFFPILKDLVVDLEPFFRRAKSVHPQGSTALTYTQANSERKQTQTQYALIDDTIKCIMCACCTAACPVNLHEDPEFMGPQAIVHAHRYIFDSRTSEVMERMRMIDTPHMIWGCKTHWKCTEVCPKGIKVTEHILETKTKMLLELQP